MNIEVVIPAKNEMKNLPQVFSALKSQTLQPTRVIFVDDGSTDGSGEYAESLGFKVISTGHTNYRERGSPEFAGMFNLGLHEISEAADYVMILGGDHVIPKNYVERLIAFMRTNDVVLASGIIENEWTSIPRGSGRIVEAKTWRNVMGAIRYGEVYGFETFLVLKLKSAGYRVAVYEPVRSRVLRRTGTDTNQVNYGRGMKFIGYTLNYVFVRALTLALKTRNLSKGVQMIAGYLSYPYRSNIASYLTREQNLLVQTYFRYPHVPFRRVLKILGV